MKFILIAILLSIFLLQTACREDVLKFEDEPKGKIYISSEPQNAKIYLNNRETNKYTPDSLYNLEKGYYKISLRRAGFRDTSFTVDLERFLNRSFFIELTER